MHTYNTTPPGRGDQGNTLVAALLAHKEVYKVAKKETSEKNPFFTYYRGSEGVELDFPGSLKAARDETQALYIVAPDNPIQSFSLIQRKALPNTLGTLPNSDLRRALGTLLDNA